MRALIVFSAAIVASSTASATGQTPAEQRAFDRVSTAVDAFNRASGPELMRATERILQAAESALGAFRTADRARDSTDETYHERAEFADRLAVTCDRYKCSDGRLIDYFDGLENHRVRRWEAWREVALANAAFCDAVGVSCAASSRDAARRYRAYANRMRGLRGRPVEQNAIIDQVRSLRRQSNDLHTRANEAYVAANRAFLVSTARAVRTIAEAAQRLGGRELGLDGWVAVERAGEAASRAAAYRPDAAEDSDRTDEALSAMFDAARETVAALRRYDEERDEWNRRLERAEAGRAGADADGTATAAAAEPAEEVQVAVDAPEGMDRWLREAAAVANEAIRYANEALQHANGSGTWMDRAGRCVGAQTRSNVAGMRLQSLTFGSGRPRYVPGQLGSETYRQLIENVRAAQRRARAACASIVRDRER